MNENTNVIAIASKATSRDRALALVQANIGLDLTNVRGLKYVGLRNALDLLPNGEWEATSVALYEDKNANGS